MIDRATDYARKVTEGAIVAGPHVRAVCWRHLEDMRRTNHGCEWQPELAARAISWFEDCVRLGDKPFTLFDWQAFNVGAIGGWRRADGTRRFRRWYMETGKGSGKTPLGAGEALGLTVAEQEHRAEGYVCARTMEQALVTYRDIASMVLDTPELRARCRIMGGENPYNITYGRTRSFLRRLAAQDKGEGRSGYRPHVVIVDEYHEHATAAMLDMMAAGFKSRRQPLMIITTNAGVSLTSPCGIEHEYAVKVAHGEIDDPTYFPFVCALDPDDDIEDERVWIKTNPSLPALPGYEYIRNMLAQAKGMPSKRAVAERLLFCIWTEAETPWLDPDIFDAALVDDLKREGEPVAALDLSARTDLTAGVLTWSYPEYLECETVIWSPRDTLQQRAIDDQAPYVEWTEAGYMRAYDGTVMDFEAVARWLVECKREYGLRRIAYDAWGFPELIRELKRHGVTVAEEGDNPFADFQLEPHPQGFAQRSKGGLAMPSSINAAERLFHTRRLRVLRNPALRSAILGAVAVQDESRNRRFVKLKSKTRIDPAVALVMSIGAALVDRPDMASLMQEAQGEML